MGNEYRNIFYSNYLTKHWNHAEVIEQSTFARYATIYKSQLGALLPQDKNAKILDIASGTGYLLNLLRMEGYSNIKGIEMGEEQIALLKENGFDNVEQADAFEYLRTSKEKFDVVFALQLIEHFTKNEAVEFLRLISDRLDDGGKVVIVTPNVLSYGGSVAAFGDFTHELQFTSRSLSQLLRASGYDSVSVVGAGPVVYDVRSWVRVRLYEVIRYFRKLLLTIERGTGRSVWAGIPVLDTMLVAVGKKGR